MCVLCFGPADSLLSVEHERHSEVFVVFLVSDVFSLWGSIKAAREREPEIQVN